MHRPGRRANRWSVALEMGNLHIYWAHSGLARPQVAL